MELLKQLYEIHSPSQKEKKMRHFIKKWVSVNVPTAEVVQDPQGNVYITKGWDSTYPCIVAHLDQVQELHSKDFQVLEAGDILIGYSAKNHRQEGLGADDKNGIWIALKCLQKYDNIKCVFFVGEEIGCVGSSACDMHFFDDCRFVIQCDRRNAGDLIDDIWSPMASDEFLEATHYQDFGYHLTQGAMTDVATLRENGLKVSAVNMSCAYYKPHTDQEFTVVSELMNTLKFVQNIIENCTDVYPYEYKPKFGYYDGYASPLYQDYYNDTEQQFQLEDLEEVMLEELQRDKEFNLDNFYYDWCETFFALSYEDFATVYDNLRMMSFTELNNRQTELQF